MTAFVNTGKGIQEVYIIEPKQFDLMSDTDIINEFALLQTKTDDSQTLSELNYIVNSKVFRDDAVQKKINDVLYLSDDLYGVSGNALRAKLLSGVYTDYDKTLHEKGYKMLVRMAEEMTPQVFAETETKTLIAKLEAEVLSTMPANIYSEIGKGNALKDSVGGLTGMIEIAKAVASGLYDLEAAVKLVSDRFGITEQEARDQLGTPSLVKDAVEGDLIAKLT
jgi:hypothetical protein